MSEDNSGLRHLSLPITQPTLVIASGDMIYRSACQPHPTQNRNSQRGGTRTHHLATISSVAALPVELPLRLFQPWRAEAHTTCDLQSHMASKHD